MNKDREETERVSISLPKFLLIAGVIIAVLMAIIWFGIPGPDTKYRFVSPSENHAFELAERCGEFVCDRVAIYEETGPDGEKQRMACALPVGGDEPLFVTTTIVWLDNETRLEITYSNPDDIVRSLTIDFAKDCTPEAS